MDINWSSDVVVKRRYGSTNVFVANFARIICPGQTGVRIYLLARSADSVSLLRYNELVNEQYNLKNNHIWRFICPNLFPLFLSDFDIFRKKKT